MTESLSPEVRNAVQEILRYLANHPDAGDTVENIAKWWIPFERLLPRWSVVEQALAYLIAQGLLAESTLPGGQRFYKVVPGERAKIARLVQEKVTLRKDSIGR
jgi:hypothetical protein